MTPQELGTFRKSVKRWYRNHGRDLPWRRSRDPYAIWISEIMLQQTTVAAVSPAFERFVARFPDVQTLAAATEEDVLRLWEGLGYYSRARNLHRAAQRIVHDENGRFPKTVEQLSKLPGIGRYTAGAIASFAFDQPAPIVEANTLRLYARLIGYPQDPRATAGQKRLWEFAESLLPRSEAGLFNQALMDLGAVVCTPRDPKCDECPVVAHCAAYRTGQQTTIPVPKTRPTVTQSLHVAVVVGHENRWLIRQCGPGERWAGLWDFPRIELRQTVESHPDPFSGELTPDEVRAVETFVRTTTGHAVQLGSTFHQLRHTVTRYRIQLRCISARLLDALPSTTTASRDENAEEQPGVKWASDDEMSELPFSTTGRQIARTLIDPPHRPIQRTLFNS